MKLYDEVRKLFGQDVSLVTIRNQAKGTLNLAVTVENKVAKLRMNMKKVRTIDIIHLHKETSDIIYIYLLQATLKVSNLQSGKKKVEDLLRKEKVENKAHQAQIKKLQVDLLVADSQPDKRDSTHNMLKEK